MQSTFKNIRKKIIITLFEKSQNMYTILFKKKKKPWNISKKELLNYPKGSLGKEIGLFLAKNNFEVLPKLERHDCYHLITGYGTEVQDEIALQYLCYGNGKKSLYLFGVIVVGTIILPDYFKYYITSYKKGKNLKPFYHLNFKPLLTTNLKTLKTNLSWKS